MRSARSILTASLAGALLLCAARPTPALELLPNVTFDADLTGWNACCNATGTAAWDSTRDHLGSSLSGSARVTHLEPYNPSGATAMFLTTCLTGPDIVPGAKVFFGATVRFELGESALGKASMSIEFRDGDGCDGSTLASGGAEVQAADNPRGSWVPIKRSPGTGIVAPAGTTALKIFVAIFKNSAGTLTASFDDVYVAPSSTPLCDGLPATILGDGTDEIINGTEQSDVIVAKGGNDIVDAKGGNDRVCGGPGNDTLNGGDGDDRLFGEGGQDTLWGGDDDDLLYGAGNNDTLHGGDGDDKLRGGTGVDTCYGDGGTNVKKKCELPFIIPF